MASNSRQSSANASNTSTKRMSTPGSSASGTSGTSSASTTTAPVVNPDKAIARLLYAMLKQKSLKDVASDPVLLEGISNGHAARMRYSRFRNAVENSKLASAKRQPKGTGAGTKACKVVKRKSVGAHHVQRERDEHNEGGQDDDDDDADGDTEVDDDQNTGKEMGKEVRASNRPESRPENRGQAKAARKKSYRSADVDVYGQPETETKVLPKEDPDIMDALASASFSSLPSPPMEVETNVDFGCLGESPLIGQHHMFQSVSVPVPVPAYSAAPVPSNDRLVVLKKRKTNMHSPTMDMDTALHQVHRVQVLQAHSQAHRQVHGYSLPEMGVGLNVGLGLSAGPPRIHSMPLLHSLNAQHTQEMSGYAGSAVMMRHHSAGSVHGGMPDINKAQAHHQPQGQGHLLGPRARLLTPSSDDLLQKQMPAAHFDDYLSFGVNHNHNQSGNDSATPHTQWTPFASPLLEDTLDAGGLDMSPYIGSASMDFSAVSVSASASGTGTGTDGMEPMLSLIDPNTSLFAMVDDQPQVHPHDHHQAHAHQAYMAAFAKHSSGQDAMISQNHV